MVEMKAAKIAAMDETQHYSRAPITEAVLDIRVQLPDDVTLDTLLMVHINEQVSYPTRRTRIAGQAQVTMGTEMAFNASQGPIGHVFMSSDEHQIFQARLDGFTFSRFAPYERWETFRNEALRLWATYREVARPEAITRVALRYINRLDLPLPFNDLREYLKTIPEVSKEMKYPALSSFFMQLQVPQFDLKSVLILNEAIVPPPEDTQTDPNAISILLDIDLFREDELPGDEEALWALFEQLRERKNEVFEASITTRARELIR